MIAPSDGFDVVSLDEASVDGSFAQLSDLQRNFVRHFIVTGGKPGRAAILAGYSAKSARQSAHMNLCNRKVLAAIEKLSAANIKAALPVAIRTLIWICINGKDERARVQAANSLLDRGGLATKGGGPTVAVQVNVNGQQAQALISEIWERKQARMSSIDDGMLDTQNDVELDAIEHLAGTPPGGDQAAGSHPPVVPIPPSSSEHLPKSAGRPVHYPDPSDPHRSEKYSGMPTWPDEEGSDG